MEEVRFVVSGLLTEDQLRRILAGGWTMFSGCMEVRVQEQSCGVFAVDVKRKGFGSGLLHLQSSSRPEHEQTLKINRYAWDSIAQLPQLFVSTSWCIHHHPRRDKS